MLIVYLTPPPPPPQEGYSKWFGNISVHVSDPAVLKKTGHSWTSILGVYTLLQSGKNEHSLIYSLLY